MHTTSVARLASVDVVRLIALAAIVAGHTFPKSELTDQWVQSWRLPLFFLLAGFFWSTSRSVAAEFKQRTLSLLLPYLVWLGLLAVVLHVYGGLTGDIQRRILLGGSYIGRPYTAFWFITALFFAVLAYRMLCLTPVLVRLAAVAAAAAASVLAGRDLAQLPLAAGTALGALVFLEAGRAAAAARRSLNGAATTALAVTCLAAGALLVQAPADFVPLDMKPGIFPARAGLAALLLGTALLLAVTSWRRMPSWLATCFTELARPALVVLLAHPLVLFLVAQHQVRLETWQLAASAFALPVLAGLVLVRTPLARPLTGVARVPLRRPVATQVPSPAGREGLTTRGRGVRGAFSERQTSAPLVGARTSVGCASADQQEQQAVEHDRDRQE